MQKVYEIIGLPGTGKSYFIKEISKLKHKETIIDSDVDKLLAKFLIRSEKNYKASLINVLFNFPVLNRILIKQVLLSKLAFNDDLNFELQILRKDFNELLFLIMQDVMKRKYYDKFSYIWILNNLKYHFNRYSYFNKITENNLIIQEFIFHRIFDLYPFESDKTELSFVKQLNKFEGKYNVIYLHDDSKSITEKLIKRKSKKDIYQRMSGKTPEEINNRINKNQVKYEFYMKLLMRSGVKVYYINLENGFERSLKDFYKILKN